MEFLNGIGWAMVWFGGLIGFPLGVMVLHGYATDFYDEWLSGAFYWGALLAYFIGTGIFLISL